MNNTKSTTLKNKIQKIKKQEIDLFTGQFLQECRNNHGYLHVLM
jgi:hypothetical protein